MSATASRSSFATHEVANQPPPLEDYNAFTADGVLVEAVRREGGADFDAELSALGARTASHEVLDWGRLANENPPKLKTFDRFGHRIDEVEFHPAWHHLMHLAVAEGVHTSPWSEPRPGAHLARGVKMMLLTQAEAGHLCPISMTYAAVPALRATPDLGAEWEARTSSRDYDPELKPGKRSAIFGMAMTEKQGGSDVRANTTRAEPLAADGEYAITGHKWFCSAPMSDAFLVLAQVDEGLSCFVMPRLLPDGTRNEFHIQRLKDKLGNRSNASSEVEFHGAWARLLGEAGRGVPTIIEMVNHTRLDCALGAAAGIRVATALAIHHASHRSAFGKPLVDQPLMRNVLADLAIESEAATLAAMRLARAYDEAAAGDEDALRFKRIATAVLKYWLCKRAPMHAVEALECHGGNGYVEESGMPRLYREAPLASIWEGSGNVQCLDLLRALARHPGALELYFAEVDTAAGADARLDAFVASLRAELRDFEAAEHRARRIVERLALALQGSLLVRFGLPASADAFCAARLAGDAGLAFGTLPAGVDARAIVERHAVPSMN
jgi:putative acyl-CoA dehydrogenase